MGDRHAARVQHRHADDPVLQREARWEHRGTRRLAGSRLVVVGPGPIGRAAARNARALGMEVAAVGRAERRDPDLGQVAAIERLLEVLGAADHVLDALPLTPATGELFDAAAFAAMPASAVFVNVGRGATVDEAALIEAMRDGGIAGAALDVFEQEPLPADSPLWSMPNVVVSPHMCGDGEGWEGGRRHLRRQRRAVRARRAAAQPGRHAPGFGVG